MTSISVGQSSFSVYTVPPMDHVDMNAAIAFVRVAQTGSFRAASKSLGMPKTSVSRKIAELEARLGVQLLRRTTRQVAVTDAGLTYVDAAQSAIASLEAAEEAVSRQQREPHGRVRVTAPSPLGHAVLTTHLAEFLRVHPKVDVQLHLTYRPVDLLVERFDIALRYGALPDSSLVAVPLGAVEQHIVASPAYLRAHRAPKTPADLAAHECLLFGLDGPSLRAKWTLVSGKRKTDVAVRGRFATDDLLALHAAVLAGIGLARLPTPMITADLQGGALVSVLDGYTSVPTPLHLVHAGGRLLPARTRALIDFLVARMTGPGRARRRPG
jgi:DNA-binding transcriptional LysR family regulator